MKGYGKSKPVEWNRTVNMLINSRDVVGRCFIMLDEIDKTIRNHFDVEEGKGEWSHD